MAYVVIDRSLTVAERWRANALASHAWLESRPNNRIGLVQTTLDFDGEDDDCGTCGGDGFVECERCDGDGCDACDDTGDADCPECELARVGIECE